MTECFARDDLPSAHWLQRLMRRLIMAACWIVVLAAPGAPLQAAPLSLTQVPDTSLGLYAELLVEPDKKLSLDEVRASYRDGQFKVGNEPVMGFGIGASPVWLRLEVSNPGKQSKVFRLAAGTSWVDHLDIYVVHRDKLLVAQYTGDAMPQPPGITPGLGYTFYIDFPPGTSEIYLRAETLDPLVIPIKLLSAEQVSESDRWVHYSYGVLYGFLTALLAYNFMLYIGLRKSTHLYYSLYLASFIATNLAYTGHGYAWWWSNYPEFQRYIIFVLMMLFSCLGLLFAVRFLDIAEHAPRAFSAVRLFAFASIVLMVQCIAIDSQAGAGIVAFSFVILFTLIMLALGVFTWRNGRSAGGYFLAAAITGVVGAATTALTVWGVIPFNMTRYHAVEFGLLAEATLLALALAYQFRDSEKARQQAEYLARHDPLSGLLNRRAFHEQVEPSWSIAVRSGRPISAIMLDIDHFKVVNDRYGHDVGDQVLVEIAQLLIENSRSGDLISRWGGEEFLLVLPETCLEQAATLAERIRQGIEARRPITRHGQISISASLGVAERSQEATLDALIALADINLYQAKRAGRNRVFQVPKADTLGLDPA